MKTDTLSDAQAAAILFGTDTLTDEAFDPTQAQFRRARVLTIAGSAGAVVAVHHEDITSD